MKVAVVCKVYNAELILPYFLEYYNDIATAGFYFYDDGSDDSTLDILKSNPYVKHIISENRHSNNKSHKIQQFQRTKIMDVAKENLNDNDYILLLDVDEFVQFTIDLNTTIYDLIYMYLFDAYITENDVNLHWTKREYFGTEYRNINFMVKAGCYNKIIHHRTIVTKPNITKGFGGFVKHFSKAISIDHWEWKCEFYSSSIMPQSYRKKWKERKGNAIHEQSDFGRPLYKWNDLISDTSKWVKIN